MLHIPVTSCALAMLRSRTRTTSCPGHPKMPRSLLRGSLLRSGMTLIFRLAKEKAPGLLRGPCALQLAFCSVW